MHALLTRRPLNTAADLFHSRGLSRLLDDAFQGWPFGADSGTVTSAWFPPSDIFEDERAVKIVAEIPGVRSEDVKITLENNLLTIRGEKRQEAEEGNERVHRYERSYGSFERTFALPRSVDPDQIQASNENGVLTVTLPKVEKARPREIPVQAAGTSGKK
ncbi:MAG TPA: Hsp20/alpha crystallin family protein [Gemmatimonadales bacterium]